MKKSQSPARGPEATLCAAASTPTTERRKRRSLAWRLLPPLVAGALRDLVQTWNVKGRELDAKRLGPTELDAVMQVLAAAAPIVEAIQNTENIATPRAIEAVVEQAEAATNAPAGINGDQAKDLSLKTFGNFVKQVLRETEFAWKEYRAGIYRAAGAATFTGIGAGAVFYGHEIVSFVAKHADALKVCGSRLAQPCAWRNYRPRISDFIATNRFLTTRFICKREGGWAFGEEQVMPLPIN